jgi:hypothetical protein
MRGDGSLGIGLAARSPQLVTRCIRVLGIIHDAHKLDIPVIFALSRRKLAVALGIKQSKHR